jgi:DNA recombination protein RmuC
MILVWVLIGLAICIVVLLILVLLFRPRKSSSPGLEAMVPTLMDSMKDLSGIKSQIEAVASNQANMQQNLSMLQNNLRGVETKIVETTGNVTTTLAKDLSDARRIIEGLKTEYESRKKMEEDVQTATHKIEAILVGSRSRGESGENILRDAFKHFPPGMIDYNFKVKGKPVEYALILTNKKRLPIDSKWPAVDLLDRITQETDPAKKKELIDGVEKALLLKVKEVVHYIDPTTTLSWVIAAVPDAVFTLCRKAHIEAFRVNVILMPYSMTIPYILGLYKLHFEYSRSIDIENLESYLNKVEQSLDGVDRTLENSVARGATMVNNAYTECKRFVAEIRAAITYLRALPPAAIVPPSITKEP